MIDITDHSKKEVATGFGDPKDKPGSFMLSKRTAQVAAHARAALTVKTYCRDNGLEYDSSVDLPCNGARARARHLSPRAA